MNRATLMRAGVVTLAAAAATFALAGLAAGASPGARSLPTAEISSPAHPAVAAAVKSDARTPDADQAAASVSTGREITISVKIDELRIGKLTISPPTGTDTTRITVLTDAPCPASSDSFRVGLSRTDQISAQLATLAGPTSVGFSATVPITAPLERTLREVGEELGTPLQAGPYQMALGCVDSASNTVRGLFVGDLSLTSPTSYQTTKPEPTPTTSPPTPAPPSPTPPATPATTTHALPVGSHPGGPAAPGGRIAYTGSPVRDLFLIGLGLSGLGVALLLAARRRTGPYQTEES